MPTLRQIIVRWANPFLANLNIGQKWVNSVCVRASVCVCVCVFWGEGVGGFVERTLNYLKPFQILIKGGGGGIKQGFWHFLKFKIKQPKGNQTRTIVFAICWKYADADIVFVYDTRGRNALIVNKRKMLTEWWRRGMFQSNWGTLFPRVKIWGGA